MSNAARRDAAAARIVEETASVLQVSVDTVMRDWKLAKTWLFRELTRDA